MFLLRHFLSEPKFFLNQGGGEVRALAPAVVCSGNEAPPPLPGGIKKNKGSNDADAGVRGGALRDSNGALGADNAGLQQRP